MLVTYIYGSGIVIWERKTWNPGGGEVQVALIDFQAGKAVMFRETQWIKVCISYCYVFASESKK